MHQHPLSALTVVQQESMSMKTVTTGEWFRFQAVMKCNPVDEQITRERQFMDFFFSSSRNVFKKALQASCVILWVQCHVT